MIPLAGVSPFFLNVTELAGFLDAVMDNSACRVPRHRLAVRAGQDLTGFQGFNTVTPALASSRMPRASKIMAAGLASETKVFGRFFSKRRIHFSANARVFINSGHNPCPAPLALTKG